MPGEETKQATEIREAARRLAESRGTGLSNDEFASFLSSLGDLHVRVGVLEGRTGMLDDSIKKSNELHEAHKEALDRMTSLLGEVKDMLSVYNKAKTTISVIGWFTTGVRKFALFLGACAIIFTLWKTGSLSSILPKAE